MEQQTLYRDAGIIYLAVALFAQTVADLAAVAVYAVADAIEELICLSLHSDRRQIFYVVVYEYRAVSRRTGDITQKIVAASGGVVVYFV